MYLEFVYRTVFVALIYENTWLPVDVATDAAVAAAAFDDC